MLVSPDYVCDASTGPLRVDLITRLLEDGYSHRLGDLLFFDPRLV
jgi:hypothetical protein